jgi:hypothetical protein
MMNTREVDKETLALLRLGTLTVRFLERSVRALVDSPGSGSDGRSSPAALVELGQREIHYTVSPRFPCEKRPEGTIGN